MHLKFSEFKQYENFEDTYNYLDLKFSAEVTLSFSVRASRDVHILLCNGKEYNTDYCYWIIIGGWDNTKSVIRKCVTGVPKPGKAIEIDSQCQKAQVFKEVTKCILRFFCLKLLFLIVLLQNISETYSQ